MHREARRSKEQVRQRRAKPTPPPGRSECISPRRWSIAAVERKRTCALWDQAPAFNNDDVPVGLGGGQQRGQTAALSCHLIPNKLETTRLPSARSASTFGHHSTFAQAVRFLPFSHFTSRLSLAALLSEYKHCATSKRPPPPAPCELCDKSSTTQWRQPFFACLASLFPRGWASIMAFCPRRRWHLSRPASGHPA